MKNLIISVWRLAAKNKLLFAISCLLDMGLIVFVISLFWQIVYKRIFPILTGLSSLIGRLGGASPDLNQHSDSYMSLAQSIEFMSLYSNLIRWLIIFAAAIFLSWIVFAGLSFFIAGKIVDRKTGFWNYTGKFSLFSVFFFILIILSFSLTIYLSVMNSKIILPIFTQGVINVVLVILLATIIYFFGLSLVIIRKKKIITAFLDSFKFGAKKILKVLYVMMIIGMILVMGIFVNYLLFRLNIIISYIGILLLLIPSISFARIIYFYAIDRIK